MALQSFNSFKELLVKKDLESDDTQRDIKFDILSKIFRFVQNDIILSNIKDFNKNDQDLLVKLLNNKKFTDSEKKLSNGEYEAIVREELKDVSDKSKLLLIDLLEEDSKEAFKEQKRLEKLAEKFQPKDPAELLEELQRRVNEIKSDIIDIEMNLMGLENDDMTNSEQYKKIKNARERRMQLIKKLQKQIQNLNKNQPQNQ